MIVTIQNFIGFLVYEEFLVKCVVHDIIEERHLANDLSSLLITNTQEYVYVVVPQLLAGAELFPRAISCTQATQSDSINSIASAG